MLLGLVWDFPILHCLFFFPRPFFFLCHFYTFSFSHLNTQSLVLFPPFFQRSFSLQPVPSHLSYWSVTCDDVLGFWGIYVCVRVCV